MYFQAGVFRIECVFKQLGPILYWLNLKVYTLRHVPGRKKMIAVCRQSGCWRFSRLGLCRRSTTIALRQLVAGLEQSCQEAGFSVALLAQALQAAPRTCQLVSI